MNECRHGYLEWIKEGDKRLICKKCDTQFVLINGEPTKIGDK